MNYTGVVAGIREAIKHMHEGGRIINMGSGVATRAGIPGVTDYTATALGRYARPEEIAAGVAFLARPDSTYACSTSTAATARDHHAAKLTAYADLWDRAL